MRQGRLLWQQYSGDNETITTTTAPTHAQETPPDFDEQHSNRLKESHQSSLFISKDIQYQALLNVGNKNVCMWKESL